MLPRSAADQLQGIVETDRGGPDGNARRQGRHRHRRRPRHRTRGGACCWPRRAPRSSSTTSAPRVQGEGGDKHPAEEVVELIKTVGSDGAVNASDVSSWQGAKELVDQAVDTFGQLDILVNNAGILRDKMSFNMEESDWDDVIRVHLKGHFAPSHHAAVYWREPGQGRRGRQRSDHQHVVGGRPLRQRRPGQLLGGQGGHRLDDLGAGPRARALRGDRQLHLPPGPDPHDREPLRRDGQGRERSSTSGTRRTSPSWWRSWPPTRPPTSTARTSSSSAATSG